MLSKKKKKEKRSLKTGYGKFFRIEKNVERKKTRARKKNVTNTKNQKVKGVGWMPWHYMAKKDVTTCEKLRRVGSEHRLADIRMGEPDTSKVVSPTDEKDSQWGGNLGNWNILVPRGKEREIDSPSSGERKGKSPNRRDTGFRTTKSECVCVDESFERWTKEGESPVVETQECSEWDPEYGEARGTLSEDTQTTAKG